MREIDVSNDAELMAFVKSGFDVTPDHEEKIQRFRYERPGMGDRRRGAVRLASTDILFAVVQVFEPGGPGEGRMHAHTGMDGFWFVLKGRARFHDGKNEPMELDPMEGLCIPRNVRYWFESIGDDDLEILQVDAIHPTVRNSIVRYDESADQDDTEERAAALAFFDGRE